MTLVNPKVSVIMSCYNEKEEWLDLSINSILNQSYENFEFIIICDNPENQDLKNILLKYQKIDNRIKLFFNIKNMGLISSLNRALMESTGEYIARMDADDYSYEDRLFKQVTYFRANPEVDFIMNCANFIDENGKVLDKKKSLFTNNLEGILRYGNISIHPTWMFKKRILDKTKKYLEIPFAEDYDFLCRCILNGYKVKIVNEYVLDYRVRENGITRSKRYRQEISHQMVMSEYKKNYRKFTDYNAELRINNISEFEIDSFSKYHNEFQNAKRLLKKKKYIESLYKFSVVFLNSKYKRNQIINYIKYKIYFIFHS